MKKVSLFVAVVILCMLSVFSVGCSKKEPAQEIKPPTEAENMAALMPDGVIGFITTSGGKAISPAFKESTMGRMYNSLDVQDFVKKIWDQFNTKIEQEELNDPDDMEDFLLGKKMVFTILQCPIIAGVVEKPTDDKAPVYGFVMINAGDLKTELVALIKQIEAKGDAEDFADVKIGQYTMRSLVDDDVPVYYGWAGQYFVIAVNDSEHLAVNRVENPNTDASAKYLGKTQSNGDALAMFVDVDKIRNLILENIKNEENADDVEKVISVMDQLGFMEVNGLSARGGFAGADLITDQLVSLASKNKGIWSSFKPVDQKTFSFIDKDAMGAFAINFDIAGFYDTVFGAIKQSLPQHDMDKIEEGIAGFEEMAGIKIRDGLLENITGEMVVYTIAPGSVLDAPKGSVVVVAKTTDSANLKNSIVSLGELIAQISGGMLQISTQEKDGVTYNYWTAMPLALVQVLPSWTIHKDYLVIATTASSAERAVELIDGKADSLLSRADVKAKLDSMPDDLVMFKYSDTKVQIRQLLLSAQQFWPMLTMGLVQEGIQLPAMLPTASDVVDTMTPSYEYAWFDADGLRSRYEGSGIEISSAAIGGGAMGAAVLMPALGKAKQKAQRVVSASNLKQIGMACYMYSEDNDDKFPPDLETLVKSDYVTDHVFESKRKPTYFDGPSYIYIAGQNSKSSPSNVLAYENTEYLSRTDKINVLFFD
ncbi:MAG: hypothetical protein KAS23_15195, partial [Anaerohalosphaera sp.]|nr:hypothetical protein [Anaerohalosphaera sp.]